MVYLQEMHNKNKIKPDGFSLEFFLFKIVNVNLNKPTKYKHDNFVLFQVIVVVLVTLLRLQL